MRKIPHFKRRIAAFALLLGAVLIFNICGYYLIDSKTEQNQRRENAVKLLSDQQMISQQMVQTIVVLAIHNSFTPEQSKKQFRDLQELLNEFTKNDNLLVVLMASEKWPRSKNTDSIRKLYTEAAIPSHLLISHASTILKDSTKSYLNNYSFTGQVRSNELSLQRMQHEMITGFRNIERDLENDISRLNKALIISLIVALLFIGILITVPTLKHNRKNYFELKKAFEETKKSELLLRTIIDSSPDLIFILDKNQKYKMVNRSLSRLLGIKQEDFIDKDDLELGLSSEMILGDITKGIKGLWEDNLEVIGTGKTKYIPEVTLFIDGKTRIVTMTKVPLSDNNGIWGMLGFAHEITDRVELLEEKINHQREMAEAIISVQEKERNEIGKELHDNVNQILTTAKLHLECMGNGVIDKETHRRTSIDLIVTAINEIRRLSKSLVPPTLKDAGLIQCIEELISDVNSLKTVHVSLDHSNINEELLEDSLKLTVFRIIQEQLTNILKYSQASSATIQLIQKKNDLQMNIIDDGKGFDTTQHRKGVGITNIINRVDIYQGQVLIESSPGNGCRLSIDFRLNRRSQRQKISAN